MSDFDDQMAEWRKTVWGTGPCPDSSQENLTLTDEEREVLARVADDASYRVMEMTERVVRGLLERTK